MGNTLWWMIVTVLTITIYVFIDGQRKKEIEDAEALIIAFIIMDLGILYALFFQ